jgi:hypothetical protein
MFSKQKENFQYTTFVLFWEISHKHHFWAGKEESGFSRIFQIQGKSGSDSPGGCFTRETGFVPGFKDGITSYSFRRN